MSQPVNLQEVHALLAELIDAELSEAQWARLRELLGASPEARRLFRQTLMVESILERYQVELEAIRADEFAAESELASSKVGRPQHPRATRRLLNRVSSFFTRPTPLSMTVAALFVGLLVTSMALMAPPVYRALTQRETTEPYRIVAEVSGLFEATWRDQRFELRKGSFLRPGRRIAIRSGAVQVRYRSGAVVTLAGPCDYIVDDENQGTLLAGQLVAHVPPPAVGFAIDTPVVNVIDLGTEFALTVTGKKSASVDVLTGRVLAEPKIGLPQDKIELLAGNSMSFNGAWHVANRDTSRHAQWRSLARRTNVQRISGVSILDVSSELSDGSFDRRAEYLVDGRGIEGIRHSALPDAATGSPIGGTMWLSNGTFALPHNPLPAHVTFDLGQTYELTGMHVWNYNEAAKGLFTRGAREVEISVSPTGKVEDLVPLTSAQGRFDFPIASGRPDYVGFAVPLGEITNLNALARVRLVRITILSNHSAGRGPVEESFAGLSEIRFAGRLVEEDRHSLALPVSAP